jgi:hypothetical protein
LVLIAIILSRLATTGTGGKPPAVIRGKPVNSNTAKKPLFLQIELKPTLVYWEFPPKKLLW